ncbi:lipoyl synthase [Chlorobium phaeobacteroides]|uniref:Lipoyl synthase n=1 Tax=Chlorobium phaeobacteroides (strain DSM 266 / SMG 266 / 2430) TaxID=290317 RepID=LIPA_CHLPD|nr:lipoyl synthase [Chlorobium phaeobacteroides]A1BFY3.1 RecName: Full=Lipoyl synthase; AltName: Full=Lip-syn; Short=LS; AltName: Full=Lipoate synthase; AltName: Full=Lipoic acid synthase; AltName: Full=Sulfur insertion protein LipA [Chlorobium phaeobacteroides DSM 266]ABL65310.1 lipoic acid synthetase [Chlorobium phaeobacteroides DSM 266]MBV5327857.1 lipoyl synthase [Chlorobium sp.]
MSNVLARKPDWLKLRLSAHGEFAATRQLLEQRNLNTVCRSAMCPNLQECWSRGTATFLLLGNICTRTCRFCAVGTASIPPMPDSLEPENIAEAVEIMNLNHVVLTSVNRDDLADGGARHWQKTMQAVRQRNPKVTLECLIPDFQAQTEALDIVLAEAPEVLNHNIETVPSIYHIVRPEANYSSSLNIIRRAKEHFNLTTKSGLMVGMGETFDEVVQSLHDLVQHGCDMVTIGQYLQPSASHIPVNRYVTPEEFDRYKTVAESLGLRNVRSGPFVRSSYLAETLSPDH